ncbi:MAG: HEAT repeat domain-containing protein [Planctomycetota bacterium]|nr:HEAT repeat domain-containing protein [Planctomycetota bacterium]MEC8653695.1 HEAT repeat domain-containing protein [Planctomycetota bacterium]MEC9047122.1 HEAT repeat domain-containing protein [Planctomycetota bacterium]
MPSPLRPRARARSAPWVVWALTLAGCAGAPSAYTPGQLSKEQFARCRQVAQAYVDLAPEYVELRDALRADPVASRWFVRYLEQEVIAVREGQSELLSEEKVRIDQVRKLRKAPAQFDLPGQRPDRRAIGQIVAMGASAVEVVIADLLTSRQEFLRSIGVEILAGLGEAAVPALLDLARRGSAADQRGAARALGAVGATGPALAALEELTRSAEWRVRSDAVQALVRGGDAARGLLIRMLADADPFVCRKAAESLGSYRDAVAAAALVAFLKQSQARNEWAGELAAQQALQQISGAAGPRTAAAWQSYVEGLQEGGV